MIETERLKMRPITWDDLDYLFELRQDPDVSRYLGGVPTREKLETRTRFHINCHETIGIGMCIMTYKPDGKMVGFSGLQPLEAAGAVEVGYSIDKAHWGLGLGTEACRAWLDYGFDRAGLPLITAIAIPENRASRHIMEKCGMKYQKQYFGRGFECALYRISKEEYNKLNRHDET
jgi:ribosomal-protein-alanine N-acetyltransferase